MRRAAEQLKHARTEDMVKVSKKMANATPEEISAMKAHADAQISYELNAAMMLKKQVRFTLVERTITMMMEIFPAEQFVHIDISFQLW